MSDTLQEPLVTQQVAKQIYGDLDAVHPIVRQCERENGEKHKWSTLLVDYRAESGRVIAVTICGRCYVRRCESSVLVPDARCIWPVHHSRPHRDQRGRWRKVAGS